MGLIEKAGGLVDLHGQPLTAHRYSSAWQAHKANACVRVSCWYCQDVRMRASFQPGIRFIPVAPKADKATKAKAKRIWRMANRKGSRIKI